MTYRIGHHTTNDDSTLYRSESDVKFWEASAPKLRLKNYLIEKGWWTNKEDSEYEISTLRSVRNIFLEADKKQKPSPDCVFTDVYSNLPDRLDTQMKEMKNHVKRYAEHYPVNLYQD